jgi:hypothetical protein
MKKIGLYILALLLLPSCTDWLTVQPENEVAKDKLYESEDGFWQALNGVYYSLYKSHGPVSDLTSTTIDYMIGTWNVGTSSTEARLTNHEYRATSVDNTLASLFLNQYNIVAQANTILDYIQKDEQNQVLSVKDRNIIKGEALALRAWIHLDLIRIWGPIPTNVDAKKHYLPYVVTVGSSSKTYVTYDDYMNQLTQDLDSAETIFKKYDLILSYSNKELNAGDGIDGYTRLEYYSRQNHMNYYAVLGLKARLALWLGKKDEALKYANEVKDAVNKDGTKKFELGKESDIQTGLTTENAGNTLKNEQLFGNIISYFNYDQFINHIIAPTYQITSLYDDKNDFRFKLWTVAKDNESKQVVGYSTLKYRCYNNLWVPQIRLAEMYLIIMECAPLDEANSAYKEFCTSRGIAYTALTDANRMSIVVKEYYKEFIAEGQLFYMNKRLNNIRTLWTNGDMSDSQYVLPIPLRESQL